MGTARSAPWPLAVILTGDNSTSTPAPALARTMPGAGSEELLAQALRVDHAGEHGAVRIYEGQLAVLRHAGRHRRAAELIAQMKQGEARHLATFDKLLVQHRVRPTLAQPIWHVAGFVLGAASALISDKAAMALTQAVETAIDEHYAEQAQALKAVSPELVTIVEDFRQDEAHHRQTAIDQGAELAPFHRLFSSIIQAGCRVAIKVSERI